MSLPVMRQPNNCYYCGLRRTMKKAERYRLTAERSFPAVRGGIHWDSVLLSFRAVRISGIQMTGWRLDPTNQKKYPDCALTLSVGNGKRRLIAAGMRRSGPGDSLRHETGEEAHYAVLHPQEMSLARRKDCLRQLRGSVIRPDAALW